MALPSEQASPDEREASEPVQNPKAKLALWNPNELLQLIKRIVTTDALNKKQKGREEYQSAGRKSQKGLSLGKGTVFDKKAA